MARLSRSLPFQRNQGFPAGRRPEFAQSAVGAASAIYTAAYNPEGIGETMGAVATYTAAAAIASPASGLAAATYLAALAALSLLESGGAIATYLATSVAGQVQVNVPSTQGATPYVTYELNNQRKVYILVGAPPSALGNNGDFAYRNDNGGGGHQMYHRASGSWSVLV